jgi:hypothetical protein
MLLMDVFSKLTPVIGYKVAHVTFIVPSLFSFRPRSRSRGGEYGEKRVFLLRLLSLFRGFFLKKIFKFLQLSVFLEMYLM